jgi:hypothetical protein
VSLPVSVDLGHLLDGGSGFTRRFVVDVIADGDRVLQGQPVTGAAYTSDSTQQVRGGFTCTFQYSDELGTSIAATDLTSWLAPFGSQLDVSMEISDGVTDELVHLGIFPITGVGGLDYTLSTFGQRLLTIGSSVKITCLDLFHITAGEDFPIPEGPASLASAWSELGRLTLLPLNRNIADAAIPNGTAYDANRLNAVFALGTMLAGTPFVNELGQIEIQPDAWPAAGPPLETGPFGLATQLDPGDLTDQNIFNGFFVRSTDNTSTQAAILAAAYVTAGPLRWGGPFGRRPKIVDAPAIITTQAGAQTYANNQMPLYSTLPASLWAAQAVPDPRRRVGDVLQFTGRDEVTRLGRIQSLTLPDSGAMSLVIQAAS